MSNQQHEGPCGAPLSSEELARLKAEAERGTVLIHGRERHQCGTDKMALKLVPEIEHWKERAEAAEKALEEKDTEIELLGHQNETLNGVADKYFFELNERADVISAQKRKLTEKDAEIERLQAENEEQSAKAHNTCERLRTALENIVAGYKEDLPIWDLVGTAEAALDGKEG